MKHILFILVFFFAFSPALTAQEGKIEIIQDKRINALVEKHIRINEANPAISGWRINLRSFSGNNSKKEATDLKAAFLQKHPDVKSYLVYQSPNFKVKVGDFRTKLDAYRFYRQVKTDFPSAYIVKDDVNLTADK